MKLGIKEYQIKDICHLEKGKQIDTDLLDASNEYKYINGGIDASGFYSEYNTTGQTITVSEGGASCGYVNYIEEPFWCGCHCYRLTDIKLNPKYVFYAVKANQDRIMKLRTGSAMPNIKKSSFECFRIRLSENSLEQKYVVGILEKTCALIELKKRQVEELDNLIKARFVEMFGDPVSNPFRWEKYHLKECLESIDNGHSFICRNNPRTGVAPAILKLSAVTFGIYKPTENKAIIDWNDFVEGAEVHNGDLLFTRKNTPELVGMSAYVSVTPEKLMMPDLIFRLNTKKNCHKIFLWKLINHDLFRGQIQNMASGSAKSMSNISKEKLRLLEIVLPPLELQNQFAAFVTQTDKSKLT